MWLDVDCSGTTVLVATPPTVHEVVAGEVILVCMVDSDSSTAPTTAVCTAWNDGSCRWNIVSLCTHNFHYRYVKLDNFQSYKSGQDMDQINDDYELGMNRAATIHADNILALNETQLIEP